MFDDMDFVCCRCMDVKPVDDAIVIAEVEGHQLRMCGQCSKDFVEVV